MAVVYMPWRLVSAGPTYKKGGFEGVPSKTRFTEAISASL